MTLRFGTDGIRGVANRELTPELVTALGRAAMRVLGTDRPLVLGRDTRRSGPMLEAALVAGACAEGANVLLVGVVPTPAVAHLAETRDASAAVISASHNAYADNGVKLFAPGGRKIPDELERQVELELRQLAAIAPDPGPAGTGVGVASELKGAVEEYAAHLVSTLEGRRFDGLHVVVDCANGAAFRAAPRVLRELGARVEVLHASPDGTNINDHCGSTYPAELQRTVVDLGADAGLAFDGDADRVIAVDETGSVVDGDQIMLIAALDLKERGKLHGDAVVATVMSNLGLRRALAREGIEFVEVPVGDRHVSDELERRGLSLGGEQSGHVIFSDLANTGDGTLTGLMLLDVVHGTGQRLSRLAGVMEHFPQVLRNVEVVDRDRLDGDGKFWAVARDAQAELGDDGRVLVRPSGTEPLVRVMVEASTQVQAESIAEQLAMAVADACGAISGPDDPDR
jgi:phosphoglucosamine mutase